MDTNIYQGLFQGAAGRGHLPPPLETGMPPLELLNSLIP